MMPRLLQAISQIDARTAIHQEFDKEPWDAETWTGAVLVLGAMAVFLLILHFILYYERRQDNPKTVHNPGKLFQEVLGNLGLASSQQKLLQRMCHDLRLAQPTEVLLSPKLFGHFSEQWLSKGSADSSEAAAEPRTVAALLFQDQLSA